MPDAYRIVSPRCVAAKTLGWHDPAAEMNAALAKQPDKIRAVRMTVLNGSRLAMGWQPTMVFNPGWNWGRPERVGSLLEVTRVEGSRLHVRDPAPGPSPPMTCTTCWLAATWPWLPLPALPPGVIIHIRTLKLEGWIDLATGEVDLDFASSFATSLAGGLWATQPLAVAARMASGEQAGTVFHAVGERLRGADATLVALSEVPPTSDAAQNAVLMLPTDALSVLKVRLEFIPGDER
ncbi:hypothetical protein CHLRE_10g463800v5 [Chlamydomonas reinhardtii]|uniref:Uncharacterized protein n=1 Tax=Chlamydomonas reinhardtii TaxID=3055 RepID=A0A2K3DC26_CHLRE|nr:uncharacterized protein CHLRE_10g463800v5 [Chlamydomonas reinhardtii]XP_042920602.1 uncharacterized protein CHLRE_10g463800v5 [Chlamydomonas reinhardtii]PNW78085.1 hypothetical protein CHLRE_10g463800v5 [Chlamydomonas reinhardtii]PNW78086.1 hypothetical protein CHLRE_10g463800v5 [Chlamydomonas reinhardtii]